MFHAFSCVLGAMFSSAAVPPPPPVNDACGGAIAILNGTFAFDLTNATTGPEGQNDPQCAFGTITGYSNDLWYCWTAPCTGTANVTTCGLTTLDTKIAMYAGCSCSGTEFSRLCCNDDYCGLQSCLQCKVFAGQQYLIQVGVFPGSASGTGSFSVDCNGASCCAGNDQCPVGSINEAEVCTADTDGGCNDILNPAQAIQCGDTICGTFWYDGTFRDTDWYEFTVLTDSIITWSVYADVPVDTFILTANCPPTILATGSGDCPSVAQVQVCVPRGTYRVFAAPAFGGPPITCFNLQNTWTYTADLDCVPSPCPLSCGDPDAGSCVAAHATPFCDNPACCEAVCIVDPFCCQDHWDSGCVKTALMTAECKFPSFCPDEAVDIYVCEEGCRDDFSASDGPEPTDPSAALLAFVPGCEGSPPTPFDVIPSDRCFKHTLHGCWPWCPEGCGPNACGLIVGATLEIRLRAGGADASNDSINLFDGGTHLWGAPISSLAGGTWNPGQTTTITLNLAALPTAPFNILNSLCDGELGVYVQDDTGVDYMSLTVIHCPCDFPFRPFFERDDGDDFTTPSPSTPSAALQAAMSACQNGALTQYDVQPQDQCFGETIDNLPTCILGGYLQIGVRPHGIFAADDTLSLEVVNECGDVFAWEMELTDLQTAGFVSPPLAPLTTSVVSLDLQNLPPDANGVRDILSRLLDSSLDIVVQDNTGVDYIFFAPDVCECCTNDITGDGVVDIDDLFSVINAWGPCPQPCPPNTNCPADVDDNCVVDVDDLFHIIARWGPCP